MKYTKNTPRLTVKFINSDNDETLIEIHDRTWMNVGEVLTDYYVSELIKKELKNNAPKNLLVLIVAEYTKTD